jgi:hypothetical protein
VMLDMIFLELDSGRDSSGVMDLGVSAALLIIRGFVH